VRLLTVELEKEFQQIGPQEKVHDPIIVTKYFMVFPEFCTNLITSRARHFLHAIF